MEQLGVLQIRTRGTRRFRIASTRTAADGLIRAAAYALADDTSCAVRAEFTSCAILLRSLLPRLPENMIAGPHLFEDAGWLSNRLAELLPIPPLAKQKLMELADADARLEVIHQFLEQQGLQQAR